MYIYRRSVQERPLKIHRTFMVQHFYFTFFSLGVLFFSFRYFRCIRSPSSMVGFCVLHGFSTDHDPSSDWSEWLVLSVLDVEHINLCILCICDGVISYLVRRFYFQNVINVMIFTIMRYYI